MPRAPFQVLVLPFRHAGARVEFAVLRRADMDAWQAVAGGGEAGETPLRAAAREVGEELGLTRAVALHPLRATAAVPARFFAERDGWPAGIRTVPEYSFAADLTGMAVTISGEHTALRWLDHPTARAIVRFDSNRAALDELHERLRAGEWPYPAAW